MSGSRPDSRGDGRGVTHRVTPERLVPTTRAADFERPSTRLTVGIPLIRTDCALLASSLTGLFLSFLCGHFFFFFFLLPIMNIFSRTVIEGSLRSMK